MAMLFLIAMRPRIINVTKRKKMLNELFDSNFSTHLKLQYLIPYILCATKLNRASRIINRFWLFVLIEIAALREMD
jgi:hypothetical protein